MGHYSDSYEHDEDTRQKEKRKLLERQLKSAIRNLSNGDLAMVCGFAKNVKHVKAVMGFLSGEEG